MKRKALLAVAAFSILLAICTLLLSAQGKTDHTTFLRGFLAEEGGSWSEEEGQPVYTYQMPEGDNFLRAYLYMNTYGTEFEIYSRGEMIYSHSGVRDGYAYLVFVGELHSGDSLVIRFPGASVDGLQGSTMLIGDAIGITYRIVSESVYVFVFCLISFVTVVVILVLALMFRKVLTPQQRNALISLSLFVLLATIWVLTDSRLLLIFTSCTGMVALISFLAFLSMPIFMVNFMRLMLNINSRIITVLLAMYIIVLNVYSLNYIFGLFDAMIPAVIEHVLMVITIAALWALALRRPHSEHDSKFPLVLMGYACYSISAFVMLLRYYVEPFSSYTRAYMLGIACFIVLLFVAACRDIYDQMQRNVKLEVQAKLAYLDAMTNIGNRAAFYQQCAEDETTPGTITYLVADVNNLKLTNDTLGHAEGDKLIIQAANCLQKAVEGQGQCYRLGGDEFVVRIPGLTQEQALACTKHLNELVREANETSELKLSIAVGCAWTGEEPKDLHALLERADAEMYREKQKMKSNA